MGGPRNGLGKEASKMTQDYLFMVEKEDSINPRLYEDSWEQVCLAKYGWQCSHK